MGGYGSCGFFVLRVPYLPLAPVDDLRAAADEPRVQDALAAASPELAAALARGDPGTRLSLTRYLARMSGRPTPRGLLAGIAIGAIDRGTALRIGEARASSRLSTRAAAAIAARVQTDPALRARISYRVNPTVHESRSGQLRYVEPRGDGHALVAARPSPQLADTLARGRAGATLAELAHALAEDGADPAEAHAFVEELVAAGLLLPELGPPAHGADPGRHLLERLHALAPGSDVHRDLRVLLDAIAAADLAAPGGRAQALAAGAPAAARLGLGEPLEHAVQVESVRAAPGLRLPVEVVQTVLTALEVLRRLVRSDEPEDLARFRDAFRERYGERRVALLEALDPEAGVGFGRDAPARPPAPSSDVAWGAAELLKLRLVADAAAVGAREVDLLAAVPSLAQRPVAALPESLALMVSLSAESEEAIDLGDYEARLIGAFGPSGARLLGRFCDHDTELREHVERHLRGEEALRPDAIFAEIAHLPPGASDIATRPALRRHEIGLFAGPGACERLDLGDLDVGLEHDEIVLRLADGRRVFPRLTTAHDMFGDGLGLYRFLAQLQFQGFAAGLSWQWGPLAGAPFLPRVRVDRVVLSPARWRIAPDERLALGREDGEERLAALTTWRRRTGCPRHVVLVAGESALPLDLEDAVCAEILLRTAPPGSAVVVEEQWPPPDRSPVCGPGGSYAHELLIPVLLDAAPVRDARRPRRREEGRRDRPPGSEWLFAKVYTGSEGADALIIHELAPLARRAIADGAATAWHFVRFEDPEFHLRLRIRGEQQALRQRVLPALLDRGEALIETGAARRLTLDTYEREIERYGGAEAIALAEAAFHADSEAVTDLLARIPPGQEAAAGRWRLAAAGTWSLLLSLGLSDEEAAAVAARLRDELAARQRLDRGGVRDLARGLRAARPVIEDLLAQPPDPLRDRDGVLAGIGGELGRLARTGRLCRTPAEIAGALAHMHCNRLLRGAPGMQELRVHDAVARLAGGRAARARRATAIA